MSKDPLDIIFINDLRVNAIIGIHAWERQVRQELIVNVDIAWNLSAAARSGVLDDTLDYGAIAQRIREFITVSQFELVETLAEKTVAMLMHEFSVPWVKFSCAKTQALAGVASVGVCIERGHRS